MASDGVTREQALEMATVQERPILEAILSIGTINTNRGALKAAKLIAAQLDAARREQREVDAKRGFDAVKAIEESRYSDNYSPLQKAASVAASIRGEVK